MATMASPANQVFSSVAKTLIGVFIWSHVSKLNKETKSKSNLIEIVTRREVTLAQLPERQLCNQMMTRCKLLAISEGREHLVRHFLWEKKFALECLLC